MVQMILARRALGEESALLVSIFCFNGPPDLEAQVARLPFLLKSSALRAKTNSRYWLDIRSLRLCGKFSLRAPIYDVNAFGTLTAVSSLPSIARGNSMALNSAPTRTTSEIKYIHTSKAMAAPSDP